MPIERIVAATDFSRGSTRALHRAAQLAALHGARLHLVTVLPDDWLGQLRAWFGGAEVPASVDAIRDRLNEAVGALSQPGPRDVSTEVLEGDPRDEIAAFAQRARAQFVVVGARGRSLVGEAVLGSTALALLERCDMPILLARNEAQKDYAHLLAGIALEPASTEALNFAAELCPDAEITLVHAYEDPFAAELFIGQASPAAEAHYRRRARRTARQSFDDFVAQLGPLAERCGHELEHGPPGQMLARQAEHQRADLVVLGSRRKGALEAALLGSVASNVALMVKADVLLVRPAPDAMRSDSRRR